MCTTKIVDLNLDCLLRIFSYCSEQDLLNLSSANHVLRNVIDDNIFYQQTLDLLMCGHRNGPRIQEVTHTLLSYADRMSIARNWLQGCYEEYEYFHHRQMFPTKLQLEHDWLYITHAAYLRQYQRISQEPLQRQYHQEIATSTKTDIAAFVKKRDTIFAGRVCGSCFIYEDGYATEQHLHTPKEYLYCVDFAGDLYVTSSDRCSKIWRRSNEFSLLHLDMMTQLTHSYKVMRLNATGERLFGGLYTDVSHRALREVDVMTGFETILNSNTLSIYDLKLKDDNIIFTANFDTTFRMHDRRSNRDECIWEDPFDSSFYCIEYDGLYAVLCGAKYHGRVNLYDIRVPGKYMQLYFPYRRHYASSPTYSIACDSRYLFVATDHNLHVFDYKVGCATRQDYRNIFSETRRI